MDLPITNKDLETIIRALSLGGDTRLYFLLKNIKEDRQVEFKQNESMSEEVNIKVFSESDEYQCKHGACDI